LVGLGATRPCTPPKRSDSRGETDSKPLRGQCDAVSDRQKACHDAQRDGIEVASRHIVGSGAIPAGVTTVMMVPRRAWGDAA
jgi:hypothetical protein